MTLTLFHAPRSRSVRVRWLMEEMGAPYELHRVNFSHGDVGGEEYKKINPLQKVPAIKDGDAVMIESVAIMQYVMARYGPTELSVAADEDGFPDYLQYLQFGESGLNMPVNLLLGHTVLLPEDQRSPGMARWARAETKKALGFVDAGLKDREFLAAGRFTAADISVAYVLFLLKLIGQLDDVATPAILDYWGRMKAREAWRRASAD